MTAFFTIIYFTPKQQSFLDFNLNQAMKKAKTIEKKKWEIFGIIENL